MLYKFYTDFAKLAQVSYVVLMFLYFLQILPCFKNFNICCVLKRTCIYVWHHLEIMKKTLIMKLKDLNMCRIFHNSLLDIIFVFALTLDANTKFDVTL